MKPEDQKICHLALNDMKDGKITEDQALQIFLKAGEHLESAKEIIGISLGVSDVIIIDQNDSKTEKKPFTCTFISEDYNPSNEAIRRLYNHPFYPNPIMEEDAAAWGITPEEL